MKQNITCFRAAKSASWSEYASQRKWLSEFNFHGNYLAGDDMAQSAHRESWQKRISQWNSFGKNLLRNPHSMENVVDSLQITNPGTWKHYNTHSSWRKTQISNSNNGTQIRRANRGPFGLIWTKLLIIK